MFTVGIKRKKEQKEKGRGRFYLILVCSIEPAVNSTKEQLDQIQLWRLLKPLQRQLPLSNPIPRCHTHKLLHQLVLQILQILQKPTALRSHRTWTTWYRKKSVGYFSSIKCSLAFRICRSRWCFWFTCRRTVGDEDQDGFPELERCIGRGCLVEEPAVDFFPQCVALLRLSPELQIVQDLTRDPPLPNAPILFLIIQKLIINPIIIKQCRNLSTDTSHHLQIIQLPIVFIARPNRRRIIDQQHNIIHRQLTKPLRHLDRNTLPLLCDVLEISLQSLIEKFTALWIELAVTNVADIGVGEEEGLEIVGGDAGAKVGFD